MRGIYKITNTLYDIVYIGESENIENRWEKHIEDLNNNSHHSYKLQADWNEIPEEYFEFKVIEKLDENIPDYISKFVLIAYEDKYIKQYDSYTNGYNCEMTLEKVLSGDKKIYYKDENDTKDKECMTVVLSNINRNNGIYKSFKIREKKIKLSEEELLIIDEAKSKQSRETKVVCMDTGILYVNAKQATELCDVCNTGLVTGVCRKGGGKVKLRNGEYLSFRYTC